MNRKFVAVIVLSMFAAADHCWAQLPSKKPMQAFFNPSTINKLNAKDHGKKLPPANPQAELNSRRSLQEINAQSSHANVPVYHPNQGLGPEVLKKRLPSAGIGIYRRPR